MESNSMHGFGDAFIRSLLLTLEHTDFNQFMDLSYYVLMQSPASVLKRKDSIEAKLESINGLIKYFEEVKEQDFLHYGSCHKNLYLLLLEDL